MCGRAVDRGPVADIGGVSEIDGDARGELCIALEEVDGARVMGL